MEWKSGWWKIGGVVWNAKQVCGAEVIAGSKVDEWRVNASKVKRVECGL